MGYTNWAPGQPSGEATSICLWMYNGQSASSRPNAGRWDDQARTYTVSYLCRLPDRTHTTGAVAIVNVD